MKRSELKAIVKECLVEILMEGVAPQYASKVNESRITSQHSSLQKNVTASKPSNNVAKTQSSQINEIARQIVPNDPVMASIFSDTASTTLREQVAADSGRQIQAQDTGVDPMSLFDNSKNWASLAFSETTKK